MTTETGAPEAITVTVTPEAENAPPSAEVAVAAEAVVLAAETAVELAEATGALAEVEAARVVQSHAEQVDAVEEQIEAVEEHEEIQDRSIEALWQENQNLRESLRQTQETLELMRAELIPPPPLEEISEADPETLIPPSTPDQTSSMQTEVEPESVAENPVEEIAAEILPPKRGHRIRLI
jgi:TolA-binding protein